MANRYSAGDEFAPAAERDLIVTGLKRIGTATQVEHDDIAEERFLAAWSALWPFAIPNLDRANEDVHNALQRLDDETPPDDWRGDETSWACRNKWRRLRWWVEAWFQDGVFAAQPTEDEIHGREIVEPDASKSTHYYAERAYRHLIRTAFLDLQAATQHRDARVGQARYDRAYSYVRALVHPLLLRLEDLHEKVNAWDEATRGRPRGAAHPEHVRATALLWEAAQRADVAGPIDVPIEEDADDFLLEAIPEELR